MQKNFRVNVALPALEETIAKLLIWTTWFCHDKRWPSLHSKTIASHRLPFIFQRSFSNSWQIIPAFKNLFESKPPHSKIVRKTWPYPPFLERKGIMIIITTLKKINKNIKKIALAENADNPLRNSKNWNFPFFINTLFTHEDCLFGFWLSDCGYLNCSLLTRMPIVVDNCRIVSESTSWLKYIVFFFPLSVKYCSDAWFIIVKKVSMRNDCWYID